MQDLHHALLVLEIPTIVLSHMQMSSNPESLLASFKALVRKRRRELAKIHHPDVSGGNPERMQEINDCADYLLSLQIRRRRPVYQVVRVYYGSSTASTSTW